MMTTYYHGGRGGLQKGNFILPPTITNAKSTAEFGNHMCDRSKVYVTVEFTAAAMYAAAVNGDVYEVEPVGALAEDPDCIEPGFSFACERARILKRHRLTDADKQLLRKAVR